MIYDKVDHFTKIVAGVEEGGQEMPKMRDVLFDRCLDAFHIFI